MSNLYDDYDYPDIPERSENPGSSLTKQGFYDSYSQNSSQIQPAPLSAGALAYRQEQLRIAAQAAEMNPELTGARPAFSVTKEQKERLMTALVPLLFFDGRVYFAQVGQIAAVKERDKSVIISHRINMPSKSGEPPTLCLPPNISFSEFVQRWAPNFAVLYGDPQQLTDHEMRRKKINSSDKSGVGNLKFAKVAINPDRVVGIYPEEGWSTCIEVSGPSCLDAKNSSGGFFGGKGDNSGTSAMLGSCSPTTNFKVATQIGDVLRKLRPDSYEDLVNVLGNRDVGCGKRLT